MDPGPPAWALAATDPEESQLDIWSHIQPGSVSVTAKLVEGAATGDWLQDGDDVAAVKSAKVRLVNRNRVRIDATPCQLNVQALSARSTILVVCLLRCHLNDTTTWTLYLDIATIKFCLFVRKMSILLAQNLFALGLNDQNGDIMAV